MAVKVHRLAALLILFIVYAGLPQPARGAAHTPPETEQRSSETPTQEHIVEIHKFKFQSKVLDVKVGDTVTWINKDVVPHTATALDKSWDSGRLKKGDSFTLTITSETSLEYFCAYHRQMKAELNLVS